MHPLIAQISELHFIYHNRSFDTWITRFLDDSISAPQKSVIPTGKHKTSMFRYLITSLGIHSMSKLSWQALTSNKS